MNVLLLSTSDTNGGAAIAAFRLMNALNAEGVNARMMVINKYSDNENVIKIGKRGQIILNFLWERLVIFALNGFSRKNFFNYSIANTGFDVTSHEAFLQADIVHIHWINQGMLSLKGIEKILQSGKKVVWTMHDMWAFRGIDHINDSSSQFRIPAAKSSPFLRRLSGRIFDRKKNLYHQHPICFVSVSNWLKNLAEQSPAIAPKHCKVIPNAIDTQLFRPNTTSRAPFLTQLKGKKILVMGAARLDAPVKGFERFIEALNLLIATKDVDKEQLALVLFGKVKHPHTFFTQIPIQYIYLGEITDNRELVKLYSNADATIVSSQMETFGQTLTESMACGCPVVSYNHGGQADIVNHLKNGYLAADGDAEDFAKGLHWVLFEGNRDQMRQSATEKINQCFTDAIVAQKYIELYNA